MEDGYDVAMFAWFSMLMLVKRNINGFQNTKQTKNNTIHISGCPTMNMVETLIHYSSQINATEKAPTT